MHLNLLQKCLRIVNSDPCIHMVLSSDMSWWWVRVWDHNLVILLMKLREIKWNWSIVRNRLQKLCFFWDHKNYSVWTTEQWSEMYIYTFFVIQDCMDYIYLSIWKKCTTYRRSEVLSRAYWANKVRCWLSDYREYSMPNPTFGCTQ